MKEKIRILLIDDNTIQREKVKKYFSNHAVIDIALVAKNGLEGLEKIIHNEKDYDVIVMDMIMPEQDGFYILNNLKEQNINKKIIVVSSYNNDEVIREVSEYGVNYYILKPYNISVLENRILSIMNSNCTTEKANNNSMHQQITKLLHSLGIPSHIKGYQYIRDGIYLMYENPDLIGGITKELYPSIAGKYETTASRVERAIRHAIEVSWNRGDYDLMEDIFGHSVDYDKAKPTNSEFIVTLADKLRLDTLCIRV